MWGQVAAILGANGVKDPWFQGGRDCTYPSVALSALSPPPGAGWRMPAALPGVSSASGARPGPAQVCSDSGSCCGAWCLCGPSPLLNPLLGAPVCEILRRSPHLFLSFFTILFPISQSQCKALVPIKRRLETRVHAGELTQSGDGEHPVKGWAEPSTSTMQESAGISRGPEPWGIGPIIWAPCHLSGCLQGAPISG